MNGRATYINVKSKNLTMLVYTIIIDDPLHITYLLLQYKHTNWHFAHAPYNVKRHMHARPHTRTFCLCESVLAIPLE